MRKIRPMTSYAAFARFYDAVQGDRAEHATYIRELIRKHHPTARTVLELACGTGSILKQLRPHYDVTGLDVSEPMLALAAEKVPGVPLIRADMSEFQLRETFDAVLCVYDSINHLLDFAQWEEVFDRARAHLNDRGIFLFDINTEHQLDLFSQQPSWTQWFGDEHLLVLDVRDQGDSRYVWSIRVFEHLGSADYRLHAEDIYEVSFPVEQIRTSLAERFRRIATYDQRRSRPTARSERLHFVCQT